LELRYARKRNQRLSQGMSAEGEKTFEVGIFAFAPAQKSGERNGDVGIVAVGRKKYA
jgi:hypothetical protein